MNYSTVRPIAHSPSPLPPVGKGPSIGNWRRARIATAATNSDRLGWMSASHIFGGGC